MNDDAGLAVFHAACAAALATDLIVDLYTFFRPPAPYHQLFVLTASQAAPRGGTYAVKGCRRDQGSTVGASSSSLYTGKLGHGASDGGQTQLWATAGPAPRAEALV